MENGFDELLADFLQTVYTAPKQLHCDEVWRFILKRIFRWFLIGKTPQLTEVATGYILRNNTLPPVVGNLDSCTAEVLPFQGILEAIS